MSLQRKYLPLIILSLALLAPGVLWAGKNQALGVLKPNGYVTVNGQRVAGTTTLFAGDVVWCDSSSHATILRSGSVTLVPSSSQALVSPNSVSISHDDRAQHDENRDQNRDDRDDHCKHMSSHKRHHHRDGDCDGDE